MATQRRIGESTPRASDGEGAALQRARDAFDRYAWGEAFSALSAVDAQTPLGPDDLQRLAAAAHLLGRDAESRANLTRAHQGFAAAGNARAAARCAFWIGYELFHSGDHAQAGGWLARAQRLIDSLGEPCVEQGYLLVPAGIRCVQTGDASTAYATFGEAASIGHRFGDTDLVTLALMGQGRALLRQGDVGRGVALLDEAMVAITANEVSPLVAGGVYCSVIDACGEIYDVRRATEWTEALARWCASQPDLVPFRGHCLVKRAELLQLKGAWPEALASAQQAEERFSTPSPRAPLGIALYCVAELRRLRGELDEAEELYGQAAQWKRSPNAGLARLRLAQGRIDAAYAAIRHAAEEVRGPSGRAQILDAFVEIALAVPDVPAARSAADDLAQMASAINTSLLLAMSSRAQGAVLFAEGDARAAADALRLAVATWRELEAPYEAARAQVLLALACRALGVGEPATLELQAARETFLRLSAKPDLARVDALLKDDGSSPGDPLTARERQVLVLIASGSTNRAIAGALRISEKTVARHVSNIFTKLRLQSRAAATAYAYRHKLV